jgi:hypothetical protein
MSDFGGLQPGDWLYIHTGTNTAGGDHSVVFSHWLDADTRTDDGVQYRRAITFDQGSTTDGGLQHTRYLGEQRAAVGGHPVYPITMAMRYAADVGPPQTAEDVIENDLQLDLDRPRGAELMPALGTGPAARKNFDFIMSKERRHHGRVDLERVKERIRTLNAELITRLGERQTADGEDRMTDGQEMLLREVNQRDDLETLVRLNERLNNILHNLQGLEAAEQTQSDRVEPIHAERSVEIEADRAEINGELNIIRGEIDRAEDVITLDAQIRELTREKSGLERSIRRLRRRLPGLRGAAKERFERWIAERQTRIAEIDEDLAPLEARRGVVAATEEAGRESTGLGGRGMSMRERRNRLAARVRRLEGELADLEAAGGFHTAHPGSGDVYRGRRGGDREPRVNGQLADVLPALSWPDLITPGAPGAAREAQDARRAAQRAARRAARRH